MGTTQYFPVGWYAYAKSPHRFLLAKWFEGHGIEFDESDLGAVEGKWTWDSETRVLTAGEKRVVTTSPPPWPTN